MAHLSVSALPAEGASVGKYVRRAVDVLRQAGVEHEVHAMGTEIECGSLRELFSVVERIESELRAMGAQRITLQLKIDERLDRSVGLADKVRSALRAGDGA